MTYRILPCPLLTLRHSSQSQTDTTLVLLQFSSLQLQRGPSSAPRHEFASDVDDARPSAVRRTHFFASSLSRATSAPVPFAPSILRACFFAGRGVGGAMEQDRTVADPNKP